MRYLLVITFVLSLSPSLFAGYEKEEAVIKQAIIQDINNRNEAFLKDSNNACVLNYVVEKVTIKDKLTSSYIPFKQKIWYYRGMTAKDIYIGFQVTNATHAESRVVDQYQYDCTVIFNNIQFEINGCYIYKNGKLENEPVCSQPMQAKPQKGFLDIYLEGHLNLLADKE